MARERVMVLRLLKDVWKVKQRAPWLDGELLVLVNNVVRAVQQFRGGFDYPGPPQISEAEVTRRRQLFMEHLEERRSEGLKRADSEARNDTLLDVGIWSRASDITDGCGSVAGIRAGARFVYTGEMNIVGLHKQTCKGVSYVRVSPAEIPLATSVMFKSSKYDDVVVTGKRSILYDGQFRAGVDALDIVENIALLNSMLSGASKGAKLVVERVVGSLKLVITMSGPDLYRGSPVRVITGVYRGRSAENISDKQETYVYTGLMEVVGMNYGTYEDEENKASFLLR